AAHDVHEDGVRVVLGTQGLDPEEQVVVAQGEPPRGPPARAFGAFLPGPPNWRLFIHSSTPHPVPPHAGGGEGARTVFHRPPTLSLPTQGEGRPHGRSLTGHSMQTSAHPV